MNVHAAEERDKIQHCNVQWRKSNERGSFNQETQDVKFWCFTQCPRDPQKIPPQISVK